MSEDMDHASDADRDGIFRREPDQSMSDLIERLKQSEGPDRELDLAIERHQSGRDYYWVNDGRAIRYDKHGPDQLGNPVFDLPEYTASLDAALALVEDVLKHKSPTAALQITSIITFATIAAFTETNWAKSDHRGKHKSPAIALLIALLQAVQATSDEGGRDA